MLSSVPPYVDTLIDEIDSALSLSFSDDFFASIRSIDNARALNPTLGRLTFVLLGVATAASLIRNPQRTPFNIGQSIVLDDFDRKSTAPFQKVFGPNSNALVDRIFYWTNGQPFLVQKLARTIYEWPQSERCAERIDEEVKETYFEGNLEQDTHLKYIQDFLLENTVSTRKTLKTYRDVLEGKAIADDEQSPVHSRLKLAGVVRVKQQTLVPRNPIYEHVFDQQWIREHTPRDTQKLIAYGASASLFFLLLWMLVIQPFLFPKAARFMAEGQEAYQLGHFEQAEFSWQKAVEAFAKKGSLASQSEALTRLAQAYQGLGDYQRAKQNLEAALSLAEKTGDRASQAVILGELGNVYVATGLANTALQFLNQGLRLAREEGDRGIAAAILNSLGDLSAAQANYSEALNFYQQTMVAAQEVNDTRLVVRSLINAAMVSLNLSQYKQAKLWLDQAHNEIPDLQDSYEKVNGLIRIGLAYTDLRSWLPALSDQWPLLASTIFRKAVVVAQAIKQPLAESHAWGYLGQIYEFEHLYQESLQATHHAANLARQEGALEAIYRWQWQRGRLLRAQGNIDEAIVEYRHAVDNIQSVRYDKLFIEPYSLINS